MPKTSVVKKIEIYRLGKTTSTNEVAKTLAQDKKEDFAVVAEEQTEGRGRKDRSWVSPPGGLYLSLCTGKEPILSLKASLAVAKTLEDLGIIPSLKWPNDVMVRDRKICGILVEVLEKKAIVGIGLNIETAPLKDSICLSALLDEPVSKERLIKDIIENFSNLENMMDTYRGYSSTIGRLVKIKTPSRILEGRVKDIDEKGRLVLDDGRKVMAGDVIHLRKNSDRYVFHRKRYDTLTD